MVVHYHSDFYVRAFLAVRYSKLLRFWNESPHFLFLLCIISTVPVAAQWKDTDWSLRVEPAHGSRHKHWLSLHVREATRRRLRIRIQRSRFSWRLSLNEKIAVTGRQVFDFNFVYISGAPVTFTFTFFTFPSYKFAKKALPFVVYSLLTYAL